MAACSKKTYFTNYSIITSLYLLKYCVDVDAIGITRCVALHLSVFLSSTSTRATFTTLEAIRGVRTVLYCHVNCLTKALADVYNSGNRLTNNKPVL